MSIHFAIKGFEGEIGNVEKTRLDGIALDRKRCCAWRCGDFYKGTDACRRYEKLNGALSQLIWSSGFNFFWDRAIAKFQQRSFDRPCH